MPGGPRKVRGPTVWPRSGFLAAALISAVCAIAPAAAPLVVRDLDGRAQTPLTPPAGGASVVFFINVDCPVSNRYAPEIARIAADYRDKPVRAYLVYADAKLEPARAREHLAAFHAGASVPAIIDSAWTLTSAAGVNVTPSAAVYTSSGRVYRGRIDDWYVRLGQNRREAVQRDVRLTLDAVLAGRPVPVAETTAVGCYIDRRER
jgi:hypothetical protein